MDYILKISMIMDTETKKNAIRDNLLTQLNNAYSTNVVKDYSVDISAIIVTEEDNEKYSKP